MHDLTWQPYRDAVANGLTVVRRRVIRSPHNPDQSVLFFEAWLPDLPMPAAVAWFLDRTTSLSLLYIHVNDNLRRCKLATLLCVTASGGRKAIHTGSMNELSQAWCESVGWQPSTGTGWEFNVEAIVDVGLRLPPYSLVASVA